MLVRRQLEQKIRLQFHADDVRFITYRRPCGRAPFPHPLSRMRNVVWTLESTVSLVHCSHRSLVKERTLFFLNN